MMSGPLPQPSKSQFILERTQNEGFNATSKTNKLTQVRRCPLVQLPLSLFWNRKHLSDKPRRSFSLDSVVFCFCTSNEFVSQS
ncbi:unnamed protein product [Periconia digitata]|uniref:Uncharacterized protein n=1 Tax=Periconia digitata TaxID=1303443 RepID=A0A9W4TZF5_9PLEO|nr:unnamed protein product [Periconia digitata]